ncbi:hypothetical protein Mterra_03449 [Calidithermus terrae]|uniref:Uncharacterized protein n=1 Tax=Calidithermus terrae TaxID=1408545 RepID=A0A399ECZ0_9DEIN|nr:hypothetical protein Mterra_03449 [Calidithermus terrae]
MERPRPARGGGGARPHHLGRGPAGQALVAVGPHQQRRLPLRLLPGRLRPDPRLRAAGGPAAGARLRRRPARARPGAGPGRAVHPPRHPQAGHRAVAARRERGLAAARRAAQLRPRGPRAQRRAAGPDVRAQRGRQPQPPRRAAVAHHPHRQRRLRRPRLLALRRGGALRPRRSLRAGRAPAAELPLPQRGAGLRPLRREPPHGLRAQHPRLPHHLVGLPERGGLLLQLQVLPPLHRLRGPLRLVPLQPHRPRPQVRRPGGARRLLAPEEPLRPRGLPHDPLGLPHELEGRRPRPLALLAHRRRQPRDAHAGQGGRPGGAGGALLGLPRLGGDEELEGGDAGGGDAGRARLGGHLRLLGGGHARAGLLGQRPARRAAPRLRPALHRVPPDPPPAAGRGLPRRVQHGLQPRARDLLLARGPAGAPQGGPGRGLEPGPGPGAAQLQPRARRLHRQLGARAGAAAEGPGGHRQAGRAG